MAFKQLDIFDEQTGLTASSDDFITDPTAQISIVAANTAAGAATFEYTIDTEAAIKADSAVWVASNDGEQTASFGGSTVAPVTGVRLNVASGTWTFKVLQIRDADKQN